MKGAIIGDIVGSVYEFDNIKTKDFPFFSKSGYFTDDTVLTVATADALRSLGKAGLDTIVAESDDMAIASHQTKQAAVSLFQGAYVAYGLLNPGAGYGGHFMKWLDDKQRAPYYSCGNGSAMRVSPVGLLARSDREAIQLATLTALPTHNHPDGINGAVATALCIRAAKTHDKNAVRKVIQQFYPYTFSLNAIRDSYHFGHFQALNAGTVPYAVQAFLESESFEDAIRNVISIGGDSDTLGAITGSIAEAYYGVPEELWETACSAYLDADFIESTDLFYEFLKEVNQ